MGYKNKKKRKGVTLVGVLIGITILSIALAAQIRLLGNTMKRDAELRNLIMATNLAREGIEIVFSMRVTEGWGKLMDQKDNTICADISLDKKSGDTCFDTPLNFGIYDDGNNRFDKFYSFLYNIPNLNGVNIPSFWRAMTIKSCDNDSSQDTKCLILVSTAGWETCDPSDWDNCVKKSPDQCKCKLIKLEKKIYNWYVP